MKTHQKQVCRLKQSYSGLGRRWDTSGNSNKFTIIIKAVHGERSNFAGLVLGCIEADFFK